MSLENASPELQLAVDLIYLLECNEIDPATALAALDIVKRDYQESCSATALPPHICLSGSERVQPALNPDPRSTPPDEPSLSDDSVRFTSCTSLPC